MQEYVMSIDSGGSKVLCLIQKQDGGLVGWGQGGAANNMTVDEAARSYWTAIQAALETGGIRPACIADTFLSILGPVQALYDAMNQSGIACHSHHCSDTKAALYASTMNNWGIVALSGTGSFVYGRNESGHSRLIGGLGDLLGDDGSGYEIGLSGLRAALRYLEGWGEPTSLAEDIARTWNMTAPGAQLTDEMNPLTRLMSDAARKHLPDNYRHFIARLSRNVASCAQDGDQVALAILQNAGEKLADQAVSLCDYIAFGIEPIPIGRAGGSWKIGGRLQESFEHRLLERMKHRCAVMPSGLEPVFGVFLAGLEVLHIPWNEAMLARITRASHEVTESIR
ncbi:BadF/BadG/BcrA/BcrD ATPase family protein [Paenibacillus spongiae]|uniref:ATPase BadF/BadG/BcrA/BcrD type domain-containing protein n=1 Tax=Paenibacillus spongiae TaxID=2909671 RepID=A0ABY5SGE8_9BACL|nr:BadF/BadG/BcrA/BcrD ATPase family protein [Paenibacillus spongiae]UVI32729.1 hypothetical protein L1F29_13270 [Paenibacillus spongiae]